jgi:hypothetical protein
MNENWNEVINIVRTKVLPSLSWSSDQKSLITIFEWAIDRGIPPCNPALFSISKYRIIIKEAKWTIQNNEEHRLRELFHLAESLSMVDLRLELGISKPEDIHIVTVGCGDEKQFQASLRNDQLDRIQASTKPFFRFVI